MVNTTRTNFPSISISVTIPQIAEGLRQLSKKDIETLEFLLNKKMMRTVRRSADEARRGRLKEL
jgi:hypothetical protein